MIDDQHSTSDDKLCRGLSSLLPSAREMAEHELRRLPAGRLLDLVDKQTAVYQKRQQLKGVLWSLPFIVFMVFASIQKFAEPTRDSLLGQVAQGLSYLIVALFVVSVGGSLLLRPPRALRSLLRAIESHDSPALVGPALTALAGSGGLRRMFTHGSGPIETSIRRALTRLLPKMTEQDLQSLTRTQALALLIPLQEPWFDPALSISALQALEHVGDEECVRLVRQVATMSAKDEQNRKVRAAADSCLHIMLARMEKEAPARALLRASGATDGPSDLLRASGHTPGDSESLLRSTDAGKS
jgi:hypothetical protein